MFTEHSELIELAAFSGFVFVDEDAEDMEVLLSASDIGYFRRTITSETSLLAEEVIFREASDFTVDKSISAGAKANTIKLIFLLQTHYFRRQSRALTAVTSYSSLVLN